MPSAAAKSQTCNQVHMEDFAQTTEDPYTTAVPSSPAPPAASAADPLTGSGNTVVSAGAETMAKETVDEAFKRKSVPRSPLPPTYDSRSRPAVYNWT